MSKLQKGEAVKVVTQTLHGLMMGNIIALCSKGIKPHAIDWMLADKVDEDRNGDSLQFKVKVLDEYCFELYELVSSEKPTLPCRHIHHINTLKDGWIIGTGEIYPNGWLLYLQQKKAETYSVIDASEELTIRRINTERDSVQRTMGVILNDSSAGDLIYASDHDTLKRNTVNDSNLSGISRSSVGVFVGKLDTIDNRNHFECVYDATEPCYYFQKLGDMPVFTGQRWELASCFDPDYKKWHHENLGCTVMYYYGVCHQYQIFNDYILLRK